jgi:hypothetical protein
VIVSIPFVLLKSSSPCCKVIVLCVANPDWSNTIVLAPAVEFAWLTAQRRVPWVSVSSVLLTVKVDGT